MEQYFMRKTDDLKNFKRALRYYTPKLLYIRDCGGVRENGQFSCQGLCKVREDLTDKVLSFKQEEDSLLVFIDNSKVFTFDSFKSRDKGLSLAYERTEKTKDGFRTVMLPTGYNPYDCHLPEPDSSVLRHLIDNHLMEISFPGRVNIEQDGWWIKPHYLYWKVTND